MVQESRRKKRRDKLLGSHQRCWIWGRHLICETLRAGRWIPWEVCLAESLSDEQQSEVQQLAGQLGVPVFVQPGKELQRRCRVGDHQGYVAKMPPFPYARPDDLLAGCSEGSLFVVLDAIQDPFNLGAIVRSAEVMGVDGLFLAATHQVGVTAQVARSSAGAVNRLPIARSDDLIGLLGELSSAGLQVVAASEKSQQPVFCCDFTPPTALILGSEGAGIRQELLQCSDRSVRIPQCGRTGSLNAAVSAGILLYEVRRQRAPFLPGETPL